MGAPSSKPDEPRRSKGNTGRRATVRLLWSDGLVRADSAIELEGELHIGRETDGNGCVLNDRYVSRKHAVIACDAEARTATLRNLSSSGTIVGTRRVDEAHDLEDGDLLVLGRSFLIFRWEPVWLEDGLDVTQIIGGAPAMCALRARLESFAEKDGVVFLQGETGTGKELIARSLHELWQRKGPFVPVSCAGLPDGAAEELLFGDDGHFRAAAGGTIYLDEIGALTSKPQMALLRAIETGRITPEGATDEVVHDARVITATHRDLNPDLKSKRFAEELHAAMCQLQVVVPPLRRRAEDILPLLRHGFGDTPMPPLDYALARALLMHPWRLNVRELLRLARELALAGANKEELTLDLLGSALTRTAGLPPEVGGDGYEGLKQTILEPPSRARLDSLLREHEGIVADVARRIGRSRKQLYGWIRQHDLDLEDYRRD